MDLLLGSIRVYKEKGPTSHKLEVRNYENGGATLVQGNSGPSSLEKNSGGLCPQ